ncbi:MAG: hypothetical protein ACP5QT_06490 [Brevinematia bacterium]
MKKKILLVTLMSMIAITGFSMAWGPKGMGPGERFPQGGGPDDFFWMADYSDPEVIKLLDKYREKMEDIYLESRKERNSLQNQRRDLYFKLKDLSKKYKSDKTYGKEIVKTMREIYNVTEKLQNINQQTMDKLKKLNEERREEFSNYTKKWLDNLEKDEAKLSEFIEKLERFEDRMPPRKPGWQERFKSRQ